MNILYKNMTTENNIFNKNDFVYFKNGDEIESSGYKINTTLMSQDVPVMKTINTNNTNNQTGGSVSSIFNNLAVPTGLLLLQQKLIKHYGDSEVSDNKIIDDDLFDKLLKMAGPTKNKKNTKRKLKSKNNRKTKRIK